MAPPSDKGRGRAGSYPNYQSRMKYELPIPYAPLGPPSDAYRDGWDRVFGRPSDVAPWPIVTEDMMDLGGEPCDVCGELELYPHRREPGIYRCEQWENDQ